MSRIAPFYTIVLILLFTTTVISQSFVRAEDYTKLIGLTDNNGVAVADYDNDNDLDIFVVAKRHEKQGDSKTFSRLFRNDNNGAFTDVTEQSGLTNLYVEGVDNGSDFIGLDGYKFAASWGDYNNDGFPDIFFTYAEKVHLFKNDGQGKFINVTTDAGINQNNGCNNTGATWFDYNNDGYLDLYVNSWGKCLNNTLYNNNGDGTFSDVTESVGLNLNLSRRSYTMVPFDFNNDGYLDMYVANDFEDLNYLFINEAGNYFTDKAQDFGLTSPDNGNDMSISMADFDLDGDFDLFTTGINQNSLFENDGSNKFSNISQQKNVLVTEWAWGSNFSDFDLDGDEDLFIVNGYYFETDQQNRLYKNLTVEGSNTFVDELDNSALAELTMSTEATDFDYDNDGDLDLFVTNQNKPSYFYENKTIDGVSSSNTNWFKVKLEGTISNRDGFGAVITLVTDAGTYKRYYSGVGFLSQSLQPVHFGLGPETNIKELNIKWPSGQEDTYQNLSSNTIIKASEANGYQILNIVPSIKVSGCTDPMSCSYNPNATSSDNTLCTYIESKTIEGSTVSGINKTEVYTYPIAQTGTATWTIEGGSIIEGQGTGQITVKWDLETSGKVSVFEADGGCISDTVALDIELSAIEALNNVSISRLWNEALLESIRNDFARPNVHARNLFHTSIAHYDAWAIITKSAKPYLIGNVTHGFMNHFDGFNSVEDTDLSLRKAISYASYRLLSHRFKNSPSAEETLKRFEWIMNELNYDTAYESTDYTSGNPAALGNYIAQSIIEYGFSDGSNELGSYAYLNYSPLNPPLKLSVPEDPTGIINPNRWQPLSFTTFIDQSGNLIAGSTPKFLGPEWGNVKPFSLLESNATKRNRDGYDYTIYNDPGSPPQLNIFEEVTSNDWYKWSFSLVSVWSSHLDPTDGVMWDISPKSIGNIDFNDIPTNFSDYDSFYDFFDGGDIGKGYQINPVTGNPYEPQVVPRADYARVLAEFWADGPDSETPPGHWFTILNYVSDHPLFEKRFNGKGSVLNNLEWDVKAYFILGGAMHDAAVSAWSIKGWYDYVRPISAIRYMAELGQSSDPNLPNYHAAGLPLFNGYIELVKEGDPLAGANNENVNKIKVLAWKGHDYIKNADTDVAGVDWILAKNWWPYQRPSFVTPPFAGYVSGHSTFSRAAAEVLTLLTGSEFFPGGMSEFVAKKDAFLVFEKGPSVDVVLQWATYRDASDQTSLSRIWGGIHPPADDLPGRLIGEKIGNDAFNFAIPYFSNVDVKANDPIIYPNPLEHDELFIFDANPEDEIVIYDIHGRLINILSKSYNELNHTTTIILSPEIATGLYLVRTGNTSKKIIINR